MYIIDASYFQKEKPIPNLLELNSSTLDELNYLIDGKVRLLLRNILGFELFNELDSNITNGVLNDNAPEKWHNLLKGFTYFKGDDVYRWQGLIYSEGCLNHSLLADFVYYHWIHNNATTNTGVGLVRLKSKNAVNVSYSAELSKHWNNFVNQYKGNCYGTVSLVDFLIDNKEDYPNANLYDYKFINEFGI